MFEGPTYSKRKIADFITVLEGFEQVLNIVQLFRGIYKFFLFLKKIYEIEFLPFFQMIFEEKKLFQI